MKTIPATSVIAPQDCVSIIRVLYDGKDGSSAGSIPISVAKLEWEGRPCIGMRWNVAQREWDDPDKKSGKNVCVGMPSSRGHAVWFILPDGMLDTNGKIWDLIRKAARA